MLIAIVVVGVNKSKVNFPNTSTNNQEVAQGSLNNSQNLPIASIEVPTGDIDATVDSFIASANAETAFYDDAAKDGELLGSDSQALDDFGQAYDENNF